MSQGDQPEYRVMLHVEIRVSLPMDAAIIASNLQRMLAYHGIDAMVIPRGTCVTDEGY